MQLEYVDVVFANRPDSNTPMEGEFYGLDPPHTNTHITNLKVENICNVDSGIRVPLCQHGVPVAGATDLLLLLKVKATAFFPFWL